MPRQHPHVRLTPTDWKMAFTSQEVLGQGDVSTAVLYTCARAPNPCGVRSPSTGEAQVRTLDLTARGSPVLLGRFASARNR